MYCSLILEGAKRLKHEQIMKTCCLLVRGCWFCDDVCRRKSGFVSNCQRNPFRKKILSLENLKSDYSRRPSLWSLLLLHLCICLWYLIFSFSFGVCPLLLSATKDKGENTNKQHTLFEVKFCKRRSEFGTIVPCSQHNNASAWEKLYFYMCRSDVIIDKFK